MPNGFTKHFTYSAGVATAIAIVAAGAAGARQAVDTTFNSRVRRPAYIAQHPRVLIDAAHNNADTATGRYKPFAALIASDGYRVGSNLKAFSKGTLAACNVLVIVNAAGEGRRDAPAFSAQEGDVLHEWVSAGGGLLLISDHNPFASSVADLCKRFGVDITRGFTIEKVNYNKDSNDETELVFDRDKGLLVDHPVTLGRSAGERIKRVISFSGTSVKGPPGSVAFLKLADSAMDVLPPPPDQKQKSPEDPLPEHSQTSAEGRAQGVAFTVGKGRVVVLAEAAMLTAQVAGKGFKFGMNLPDTDNRQLALNIMHWLSGLLK
jgi:hypothetical protein